MTIANKNKSTPRKLAKTKQSKGTEKANEIASKEIIDCFNAQLKKILKSWSLITKLDIGLITKPDVGDISDLYFEIEQARASIGKNDDENITSGFKLLTDCAKIPIHIAEGLKFSLTNKTERTFKEYEKANRRYNAALESFQKNKELFSMFEFLLDFSKSIISILKEDSFNASQCKKGKYIDQVKRFTELARAFRRVGSALIRFDNEDKEVKDLINGISTFVMKVAYECDGNADKIEADNNEMAFLQPIDNKVFIVHGHDEEILQELKEILKNESIEPVILSEMPDRGKTVIEKFEHYAKSSGFAFVIITSDDCVKKSNGKFYYQGRPNVLFELGWFYGRFGRDKVRILKGENVEMPSDLAGIMTLNFNNNLKEVCEKIGKDLEDNGIITKE